MTTFELVLGLICSLSVLGLFVLAGVMGFVAWRSERDGGYQPLRENVPGYDASKGKQEPEPPPREL